MQTDDVVTDTSLGEVLAFVALARSGSFTAAAGELHLSQPGFSARIARLERAVGLRLVDRDRRPTVLTSAGAAFLPFAESALSTLSRGRLAARSVPARRTARVGGAGR